MYNKKKYLLKINIYNIKNLNFVLQVHIHTMIKTIEMQAYPIRNSICSLSNI